MYFDHFLTHFQSTHPLNNQIMDKTKLGATGKSGGAKKVERTSTLPKLSFSYHIIKARDIQKWIIDLQSVLFNEQNKNQIKSYSIQVRKDEITLN